MIAKQYRLQLDEETDDQRDPQRVVVSLRGDAYGVATWLLSIADTITQDEPEARETLYRQATVLLARLERERRLASEPEDEATQAGQPGGGQR